MVTWREQAVGANWVCFVCAACLCAVGALVDFSLIQKIKRGLSVSLRLAPQRIRVGTRVRACICQSIIARLTLSDLFFLCRYTTQMLSLPLFLYVWPQTIASGTRRRMQNRQWKVSADWLRCVSSRKSEARRAAESASHSSHFHHDLEAYYIACRKEKRPCVVFHQGGGGRGWGSSPRRAIACQLGPWLTGYESIDKFDLIFDKSR